MNPLKKYRKIATFIYISFIGLISATGFHWISENFISLTKGQNFTLKTAYKEIHNPRTKAMQKKALNFISETASQSNFESQEESLKALNHLSGIIFHFGAQEEGQEALKKIYENIFITKNDQIRIRSVFYLEWIALKWKRNSLFNSSVRSTKTDAKEISSSPQDTTDNLALQSTQYLMNLLFLKRTFLSQKEQSTVLNSLYTISKNSSDSEARVFAMNQMFNLAYMRNSSKKH